MVAGKRRRERERTSSPGPNVPPSSPPPTFLPPSSSPASGFSLPEEDLIEREIPELENEDDEGEDLFGDDMENDYRENVRLDAYEMSDIDDEEYDDLDPSQRLQAEREMRHRDGGEEGFRGNAAGYFLDDLGSQLTPPTIQRRKHRRGFDDAMDLVEEGVESDSDDLGVQNLEDMKGKSISEWISLEGPRKRIRHEFKHFLLSYVDENGNSVYGNRIKNLCQANKQTLEVNYQHLLESKSVLAYFLANSPHEMLKVFDSVAFEVILSMYSEYDNIQNEIFVRITDLPISYTLRDLRRTALNALIRVSGVITRRTGVFPQLKYVKYNCLKCGAILGPFYQDTSNEIKISNCSGCQSKGPFVVNSEQTIYRNFQRLTLQESPGSVPAGRLPRHKEIILQADLVDCARPGEEIEVTGIYRNNFDASLNTKNGFPVFATVIEANYIGKKEDLFASFKLTEDDEKQIRQLAKDENIGKRLIQSVAPSIYGHENIKTAIALLLFGGVPKNINDKHPVRGDINLLMLGDPGTAKSQFLKYIEKTAHRSVYTTGQGASAVGLTASVRKDPITREWTLEGGALVLADKGICMIDEFDKMNDTDRTSIHEAMEQQSISISKAGIVTTLHARCSVVAAANPIRGRYNSSIPFSQNVDLTEPILSRFDILCVVKDMADPVLDTMLADFITKSHIRSHPLEPKVNDDDSANHADSSVIPQTLLKKYIMYARDKVKPKIHNMDTDKVAKLYSELRRESLATGSIPMTVRHLESILRMAEAHARMHLREFVRSDDIDMAIRVMLQSFISAQKFSVMKNLKKAFSKYVSYMRDNDELLYHLLSSLVKDNIRYQQYRATHSENLERVEVDLEDFKLRAREVNIQDVDPFLQSSLFSQNGFSYDASRGIIIKTF